MMTNDCFNNIRIVLVETSHPGNIGAAARAMKNMGLDRLYLVNPKVFPHADAAARAAGADDILEHVVVAKTLDEAITNCSLVIGSSARLRSLPLDIINPRQCAIKALTASESTEVALVFGQERTGLSNEYLLKCNYHMHIPATEEFSSLNLAAAVQIVVYELRMASESISKKIEIQYDAFVTADELQLFYEHLEKTLIDVGFLKTDNTDHVMHRLRRLFNRAHLEKVEMNILRGILAAIQKTKGD